MSNDLTVRRAHRCAFTLVELLVVIAIIAILIGILLPTLSRIRRQANSVKCASAMREIGKCFSMYSWDNKGKFPVVKWEYAEAGSPSPTGNHVFYTLSDGTMVTALYWMDMLLKYTTKQEFYTQGNKGVTGMQRFAVMRNTIFWGCPEWSGSIFNNMTGQPELSYSENGYGYNIYPMFKANTTNADYSAGQNYKRYIAMSAPSSNGIGPGSPAGWDGWHPYRDWNPSAETCLVTEATLWLLICSPLAAGSHAIDREPATGAGNSSVASSFGNAGANNIDRYRHGKYPKINGDFFIDTQGGRVQYNMLFADGHVATCSSINEAYKAICKRD